MVPLKKLLGYKDIAPSELTFAIDSLLPSHPPARALVLRTLKAYLKNHRQEELAKDILVTDIGCSFRCWIHRVNVFPTLTAGRSSQMKYWAIGNGVGRKITADDLLRLQGIKELDYEAANVSAARVGHMCGNAMSKNLLMALLPNMLTSIGITPGCGARSG